MKTDDRDLLRSHVWGCPTFVLDPKLQNDQKIPKWNKRSVLVNSWVTLMSILPWLLTYGTSRREMLVPNIIASSMTCFRL
jgi:hypothetical protein